MNILFSMLGECNDITFDACSPSSCNEHSQIMLGECYANSSDLF